MTKNQVKKQSRQIKYAVKDSEYQEIKQAAEKEIDKVAVFARKAAIRRAREINGK